MRTPHVPRQRQLLALQRRDAPPVVRRLQLIQSCHQGATLLLVHRLRHRPRHHRRVLPDQDQVGGLQRKDPSVAVDFDAPPPTARILGLNQLAADVIELG
jgi:hypothetical protein